MRRRRGPGAIQVSALAILTVLVASTPLTVAQETPDRGGLTAAQQAWLDENGPLRVAVAENARPPAAFWHNGSVHGWGYEILQLGALKAGVQLEFVPVPDGGSVAHAIANGSVDVGGVLAPRTDIDAVANMSTPFAWSPQHYFTNDRHPDWRDASDVVGRVSAIPGTPAERRTIEQRGDLVYLEIRDPAVAVRLLADDRLDAVLGSAAVVGWQLREQNIENVRPVGDAVRVIETGFWANDPMALSIVNAMRARVTDEELAIIHVKWTGFDLGPPTEAATANVLPTWFGLALMSAALVAAVLGAFVLILRREVARRTGDLEAAHKALEQQASDLIHLVDVRTADLHQRTAELRRRNDALERFAAAASHDLRAPLLTTRHMLDLLAETKPGPDPEERRMFMENSKESLRRMDELIQALMTFGEVSGAKPEPEPVDLEETIEMLRLDLTTELEQANATLEYEGAPRILMDPRHARIMFQNLVENAIKYGHPERPPLIVIRGHTSGDDRAIIEVEDNGIGIPDDEREAVFEAFRRGSNAPTGPGHGLGLSTVKEIVERHGGHIEIQDGLDGGTRFHMELPAAKPAQVVAAGRPRDWTLLP